MATLSQAWNIATGALASDQAAISVVSQNIANASMPGYTTEAVHWGTADTLTVAGQSQPTGVVFAGAVSQRDRVLNQRIDQQAQDEAQTAARLGGLNDLQSVFSGAIGTTTSATAGDLGQQLSAFFNSFSQLAADPSNITLRIAVLSSATSLTDSFRQASASITAQRSGLDQTITSAATKANGLTSEIAALNAKITSNSPGSDAGTLEDQRQVDIEQLSQLIGIHTIENESNGLTLTTLSGAVLVAGGTSHAISITSSAGVSHLSMAGVDQTSALSGAGGQIGGALTARDGDLVSAGDAVDQLAFAVANAVNAQQASGVDLNGAGGAPLFNVGTAAPGAAADIGVALTDPRGIAAGATGSGSLDGTNATALAALASASIVNGATATNAYSSLVGEIGSKVSESTTAQVAQSASLTQLRSQQSALSSVNLNDQAALLQSYEQAYQASAKVFTILNTLIASALNLGTETAVSG